MGSRLRWGCTCCKFEVKILTCASKKFPSTMSTTIRFPKATVSSHTDCNTDFMLAGACVKENSRPVTENITSPMVITTYWGISHRMWMLFDGVIITYFACWNIRIGFIIILILLLSRYTFCKRSWSL